MTSSDESANIALSSDWYQTRVVLGRVPACNPHIAQVKFSIRLRTRRGAECSYRG